MNDKCPEMNKHAADRNEPMATRVNHLTGSGCGAQESDREPKATRLMHTIIQQRQLIDKLSHLRARIAETPISVTDGDRKDSMPPTNIVFVLDEGPSILMASLNEAIDIIGQIESDLF